VDAAEQGEGRHLAGFLKNEQYGRRLTTRPAQNTGVPRSR